MDNAQSSHLVFKLNPQLPHTRVNLVAVHLPGDGELRGEQPRGLLVLPRFRLPTDYVQLFGRGRLKVLVGPLGGNNLLSLFNCMCIKGYKK